MPTQAWHAGDGPLAARGFTMIELIVVMAVIGLLLTIAVPRYMHTLERGEQQAQRYDIAQIRKAIDQHYADRGVYPDRLEDLVERRYLRELPRNPRTNQMDWIVVPPPAGLVGAVYDVRAPDGEPDARGAAPDEPASAGAE